MRDGWTIPDDDKVWQALAEDRNSVLATPFTSKSLENTKPHYAGFSFLEALALAARGGTIPLARFILDRNQRERFSEENWRLLAGVVWSLQRRYVPRRGRPYRLVRAMAEYAERDVASLVARLQSDWRTQNSRQRVPREVTEEMVERAIAKVAADLKLSVRLITANNVRNLLKSGRK